MSWDDRLATLTEFISVAESGSGCSTSRAASAASCCRRRARPASAHYAGVWKRDDSGFFLVSDRGGEFLELMFYRIADGSPDADLADDPVGHRGREPRRQRPPPRRARQRRRPQRAALLRRRDVRRASVTEHSRRQRRPRLASIRGCRPSRSPSTKAGPPGRSACSTRRPARCSDGPPRSSRPASTQRRSASSGSFAGRASTAARSRASSTCRRRASPASARC